MEFGIFLTLQSPEMRPSQAVYQRGIELVITAEELGFSRAWLAEHHFSTYSYVSSPAVLLSYLAALTHKIRLGTAIIPIPLHNPILAAEQMAAIDVLSNGRIEVGLGKGYQKYQFDRLGVKKDIDIEQYKESIDLFCAALSGKPFEFSGEHFSVPETVIFPQPVQQPPPTWIVVNTKIPDSIEFALQRNMNIFTGVFEPFSQLTNIHDQYPQLIQQSGTFRIGTQRPVFVSYNKNEIIAAVEEVRWNARVSVSQRHDFGKIIKGRAIAERFPSEPPIEHILEDHVIFGTPEECIQKLRRLETGLGCNYFSGSFWFGNLSQEKVLDSMKLFSEEVMPAFAKEDSETLAGT